MKVARLEDRRRIRRIAGAAVGIIAAFAASLPATATATTVTATPSTLTSVFANAQGGDTILLASGDYGTFTGGMKSGEVTIREQDGASASIALDFDPAANITIDGLTITYADFADLRTKNITLRNSDVPGQILFRSDTLVDANILLDRNVHRDFDKCSTCAEGRIALMSNTSQPSGITISNSEFRGGLSDGIANGANGLRILNNVFHDLERGTADGVHTDAIQLYGSRNTLIKGNYMYRVPAGIMSPDGADHEVIEDNVLGVLSPFAIQLGADNGTIIRHNTLLDGLCDFDIRCGIISLGGKSTDKGHGTVIENNIAAGISLQGSTPAVGYNLFSQSGSWGSARGVPRFVGGQHPTTFAGYALADGSPGKGSASDGGDVGIRLSATHGPPSAAQTPDSDVHLGVRVLTRLRTLPRTGKLRIRVAVDEPRVLLLSARVRPGRAVTRVRRRHSRRTFALGHKPVKFSSAGSRTLSFKVTRAARRALARSRDAQLSLAAYADPARTAALGAFKLTIRR